jgi:hypothetical protein
MSLQLSQDAPKNATILVRLPMNRRRRGRTTKACFSSGFMGFLDDFRTSLDVAGSLWSWDGWPLGTYSK